MNGPVLGLDLSLTGTGIAVVPERWALDWSRVVVSKVGHGLSKDASERERYLRVDGIAMQILDQVRRHRCRVACIEAYAFSKGGGAYGHLLGELGGVVKRVLFVEGVEVVVTHASSARKPLGKQPRKGAKVWAHQRLFAAGAPKTWNPDQLDAFLQANNYLSTVGMDALMLLTQEAETKKPRARKAAA